MKTVDSLANGKPKLALQIKATKLGSVANSGVFLKDSLPLGRADEPKNNSLSCLLQTHPPKHTRAPELLVDKKE